VGFPLGALALLDGLLHSEILGILAPIIFSLSPLRPLHPWSASWVLGKERRWGTVSSSYAPVVTRRSCGSAGERSPHQRRNPHLVAPQQMEGAAAAAGERSPNLRRSAAGEGNFAVAIVARQSLKVTCFATPCLRATHGAIAVRALNARHSTPVCLFTDALAATGVPTA